MSGIKYPKVAVALCDRGGATVAIGEFMVKGSYRGGYNAMLGHGSSVRIRMQNETDPNDELIVLCSQYYRDFVYGWRLEYLKKLEEIQATDLN